MKKILYFYPHKFSNLSDGSHVRAESLLQYFKSKGFLVDMISFENSAVSESFVEEKRLVNSLHLINDNPFIKKTRVKNLNYFDRFVEIIKRITTRLFPKVRFEAAQRRGLPDFMTSSLVEMAAAMSVKVKYDFVLVAYSYWASVIDSCRRNHNPRMVCDTNDFLTLQQFYSSGADNFQVVGNMFSDELKKTSSFDDVIHISNDEVLLFSNFIPDIRHHFIPQFFRGERPILNLEKYKFDLLFIGSDNPYNTEGISWFIKDVLPLLGSKIKFGIAGNICKKIALNGEEIEILGFVENIHDLYNESRIVICPIKRGSGMKIKVIESLAFGKPVVSTIKGIDGFPNKDMEGGVLLADQPEEFANHINSLMGDSLFYEKQSALAREIFDRYFSLEVNYLKLDRIFDQG
jgi:glycosyltransferase involved in cell wall biosynthesis